MTKSFSHPSQSLAGHDHWEGMRPVFATAGRKAQPVKQQTPSKGISLHVSKARPIAGLWERMSRNPPTQVFLQMPEELDEGADAPKEGVNQLNQLSHTTSMLLVDAPILRFPSFTGVPRAPSSPMFHLQEMSSIRHTCTASCPV